MYVPMHMYVPTHIFCTVVEPHTMYETCQSGLNWNVVLHTHVHNVI